MVNIQKVNMPMIKKVVPTVNKKAENYCVKNIKKEIILPELPRTTYTGDIGQEYFGPTQGMKRVMRNIKKFFNKI